MFSRVKCKNVYKVQYSEISIIELIWCKNEGGEFVYKVDCSELLIVVVVCLVVFSGK